MAARVYPISTRYRRGQCHRQRSQEASKMQMKFYKGARHNVTKVNGLRMLVSLSVAIQSSHPEQLQREWGVESKCIQAYLMCEIERGGFSASCLRPMVPSLPCPHKAGPIPLCWDNPSPKQWQTGTNLRLWAVLEQERESKERGAGRETLPPPRNK